MLFLNKKGSNLKIIDCLQIYASIDMQFETISFSEKINKFLENKKLPPGFIFLCFDLTKINVDTINELSVFFIYESRKFHFQKGQDIR